MCYILVSLLSHWSFLSGTDMPMPRTCRFAQSHVWSKQCFMHAASSLTMYTTSLAESRKMVSYPFHTACHILSEKSERYTPPIFRSFSSLRQPADICPVLIVFTGTGAVYSFDPVGSYEREACRAAGAAQSLVQPFLDNQVSSNQRLCDYMWAEYDAWTTLVVAL